MGHQGNYSNTAADRAIRSIDRKREQERKQMLQHAYQHAEDLAIQLVQKLLDEHILETTSDKAIKELVAERLKKLSEMEEFDIQFKTAPLRGLVNDPNFLSLYFTQYLIEDLIEHPKVQDVFGDDATIYRAVDAVFSKIRPR
ncbi:MAG: hypothetical protein OEV91_10105 [Desulfobulbaceae bacterium]|nr:hypothetical protein [Desulfobulbaceae bacterium]